MTIPTELEASNHQSALLIAGVVLEEARDARSNLLALLIAQRERSNHLIGVNVGTAAIFIALLTTREPVDRGSIIVGLFAAGMAVLTSSAAFSVSRPMPLRPDHSPDKILKQFADLVDENGIQQGTEATVVGLAQEIDQMNSLIRDEAIPRATHTWFWAGALYLGSLALWIIASLV